ncbi:MAG TPA: STAS domain-containing protein [Polyangia bacterium]|nr:STAS domain-containing protein [Polyangia bacterium]
METTTSEVQIIEVKDRELSGPGAMRLLQEWDSLLRLAPRLTIVDLSRVRFIDSLAVSCLLRLARQATGRSRLVLVGLSRYARTVAEVTHLDEIVEIAEDVAAAKALAAAA